MPNGFWYASGPDYKRDIAPGSAFSKGDLLTLDDSSDVSRLNPYTTGTGTQYAIAIADSTDSINGKCTVQEILPGTRFWSMTTAGVTLERGDESSVSFSAAKPGRYWVDAVVSSGASAIVVVDHGTDEIDQSIQSKIVVRFKYADSELDLS